MLKRNALLILILSGAIVAILNPQTLLQAQKAKAGKVEDKVDNEARAREALLLLSQARKNAIRIKNHFQQDLLLEQIGVAQARAGDLEAAIATVNAARYPISQTFDEIGKQLAKTNDLTRAQALGRILKEGGLPAILANVVNAQAKRGQIASALRAANLISNLEVRSYAFERIAMQQALEGDDAGARKTFSLARQTYPAGHFQVDDLDEFLQLRDIDKGETPEARARILALESPDQKVSTMVAFAEVLSKKGDLANASQWLEDALKELPAGSKSDFDRYFIIPIQVRVRQKEAGMLAARALPSELRVKGYMAVAVTCAEMKDAACVEAAVEKMRSVKAVDPVRDVSEFGVKLMILNVMAALIDNGQLREADRWLSTLEEPIRNSSYHMGIEPRLQLLRVLISARENQFDTAQSLALKMRPNSITDVYRGNALRITALLETKQNGTSRTLPWSRALVDVEDQAYGLLGIAQALLEMDDVKAGYTTIMVH